MEITRRINGKSHIFTLTESELWEAWQKVETQRQYAYIRASIRDYECCEPAVYERLHNEEVVDEIWQEAHFRAEAGWGSFETNADMLIESKLEELEDGIDLTEDEEE